VIEFQKNGNAHMHILLNNYLPIRIVRKLWQHVGGGIQMNVKKVQTLIGISNYISDYIVKGIKGEFDEKDYGFKYFERRYSISKSCIRPKKEYISKHFEVSLSLAQGLKKQNLDWILYNLSETTETDTIIKFEEPKP
jgi:hypothetical protein